MTSSPAIEIIPNKLYWISASSPPRNKPNAFYFCVDNELVYLPFCSDFGPLNIGMTYKFCTELDRLMKNPEFSSYRIYHYTSLVPAKRANAACLICAYQILFLNRSASQAWARFAAAPPFIDFRDAGYGGCTYKCTILHVLNGLERAIRLNWFNVQSFNVEEYEFYEKVENGDWNWIIPNKLLAFACPQNTSTDSSGFQVWTPENYCALFKKIGVSAVVRLNNKTYDETRFTRKGIRHYDLPFTDGSCPEEVLIDNFLTIAEKEPRIAVHCKAGLGRTGTLIGCYAMKHFGFPGADFIGWARLCRPGSVLGPEEEFLCDIEELCFKEGEEYRSNREVISSFRSLSIREHIEESKMSPEEEEMIVHGDRGEAERLLNAKRANESNPNSPASPLRSPVKNGGSPASPTKKIK